MIRLLGENDARELRTLRLNALRDAPDSFLGTYEAEAAEPESLTVDRLRRTVDARDSGVLGAFEDGALVGMLGIARDTGRKASHRARLWGMYVAPAARKRGVARALLDAAIARLRAAGGVEQVHLTVTADPAHRLYARAGFVVIGTLREAQKDGERYIDEEWMVLRL
ncbi:MAG: GNAT family N-acetyltransferase [Polyangiaceae bacterium]|nr:GNAT family N-acetyltransferase [Polyangiaceae bacterium]